MGDPVMLLGFKCGTTQGARGRTARLLALASASSFGFVTCTVLAQAAGDSLDMLEEVVVTAEKQGRSLRETATSVSVFDEQALETQPGLAALSDVITRLPNTSSFGKSGIVPTVRGVDGTGPALGATAFFAGTRNRLNVQVDGRALSYNEVAYGDAQMWDVAQVEALRGPQSTLQGRNAIGGTIAIKTQDPTYEFGGAARAVFGNQDLRQGSIALSGPVVSEQVAVRFSADHREYDSYVKMTSPTVYGNKEPEHYTATTLRGKVLIEPAALSQLRALLTVSSVSFEGPQVERVRRPFDDHISSLGAGEPVHKPKAVNGTLSTWWTFSDALAFENTLSYTDFRFQRFALSAPAEINGDEFSWEPRLRVKSGSGKLNALFGGYFYDAQQSETINFGGPNFYRDETQTIALFAEADIALTDQLKLVVGARGEQEDRLRNNVGNALFRVSLDDSTRVFLPKLGLSYQFADKTNVGFIVSRGYNGGGAGFTFEPPFVNFEFDPEYVWNYEIYARSDIGRGVFLTANVFYSDYKDMQIPFDNNPDPALMSQIILNADKVTTTGAEVGLRWQVADSFRISADLGVLDTSIDAPAAPIDGGELARAAKLTGGLGWVYGGASGFELSMDARYSGKYFSDELNDPRGRIDPYWTA
ncbi:TonB-dependent receptor, partial [Steroidobacter sp.]|uniref:TonB-dependent receptor n=1 Tax=Steroidobacter sp. TaxID=1978227 RepID=UPI001A5CD079